MLWCAHPSPYHWSYEYTFEYIQAQYFLAWLADATETTRKATWDTTRNFKTPPPVMVFSRLLSMWGVFQNLSPCDGVWSERVCLRVIRILTKNVHNKFNKILICAGAVELNPDGSTSKDIFSFFWKSIPRRIRFGDFDTICRAWIEVYINTTGEFTVCMYVMYVCVYV